MNKESTFPIYIRLKGRIATLNWSNHLNCQYVLHLLWSKTSVGRFLLDEKRFQSIKLEKLEGIKMHLSIFLQSFWELGFTAFSLLLQPWFWGQLAHSCGSVCYGRVTRGAGCPDSDATRHGTPELHLMRLCLGKSQCSRNWVLVTSMQLEKVLQTVKAKHKSGPKKKADMSEKVQKPRRYADMFNSVQKHP